MQKLSTANLSESDRFTRGDVCAIVGMSALIISLFKRLLYPIVYTYYRVGAEGAIIGQATYAVALVLASVMLLACARWIVAHLGAYRWITGVFGIAGAVGLAMITSAPPHAVGGEGIIAAAILVALYVPVHCAFWVVVAACRPARAAVRNIGVSAIVAAVVFVLLGIAGAQTAAVSVACPLISTIAALIAPAVMGEGDSPELLARSALTAGEACAVTTAASEAEPADTSPRAGARVLAKGAEALPTVADDEVSEPESPVDMQPESQAEAEAPPAAVPADAEAAFGALAASLGVDPGALEGFGGEFGLSDREIELAAYAYRNYSARMISTELFIAESTVYTHLKRIYRKTDVHSKHELIELIDAWKANPEAVRAARQDKSVRSE